MASSLFMGPPPNTDELIAPQAGTLFHAPPSEDLHFNGRASKDSFEKTRPRKSSGSAHLGHLLPPGPGPTIVGTAEGWKSRPIMLA